VTFGAAGAIDTHFVAAHISARVVAPHFRNCTFLVADFARYGIKLLHSYFVYTSFLKHSWGKVVHLVSSLARQNIFKHFRILARWPKRNFR